jgi:high-affinity K+ transport system ATPase subunit B
LLIALVEILQPVATPGMLALHFLLSSLSLTSLLISGTVSAVMFSSVVRYVRFLLLWLLTVDVIASSVPADASPLL